MSEPTAEMLGGKARAGTPTLRRGSFTQIDEEKGVASQPTPASQPQGCHSTGTTPSLGTNVERPLFALIIGINEYKFSKHWHLDGAVPDAKAVKSYLEMSLSVPTSQIKTLYNEEATRDAIVDSLRALANSSSIQEGDAVLIFFAGHGSTAATPAGWEAGGPNIQVLVPYDFNCEKNGANVYGLPDRTICALLEDIALKKGDNITVIFDCCYAGSLTRRGNCLARRIMMVVDMPQDLDESIWLCHSRAAVTSGFVKTGLSTHVLLAACGAEETANEESGRGLFTKALLDTLATVDVDKVTYTDLVQRIPMPSKQNPQCEGYNQNRILFNFGVASQRRDLYVVHKISQSYVMNAGAAHGITKGAVFAIYRDRESISTKPPLTTMTTSEPDAFDTTLIPSAGMFQTDVNDHAVALQTLAGKDEELLIYAPVDAPVDAQLGRLLETLTEEMKTAERQIRIVKLEEMNMAELGIAFDNTGIVFNILDPRVTKYGQDRMPFCITPDIKVLHPIIWGAAHYFWHLRRNGNAPALKSKVQIQFTKLEEDTNDLDDNLRPVRKPYGPNLVRDDVVDFVVDNEAMYGIDITNTSSVQLYASVFFFDNGDLSITSYFRPGTSRGKVDAPLPPRASIAIGYGSGGAESFRYRLRDGHDIEVGFIKIFISTQPVDLSHVPQSSPFKKSARAISRYQPQPLKLWHAVLLTVVQRRNASL